MGCDIHFLVVVKDKPGDKYAPVICSVRTLQKHLTDDTNLPFAESQCEPPYFRWYPVFGMLTEGKVRYSSIYNIVPDYIVDEFKSWHDRSFMAIEYNGKFDWNKINWARFGAEYKDLTEQQMGEVYAAANNNEFEVPNEDSKPKDIDPATFNFMSYWFSDNYHSHNHFTLRKLRKLIKNLQKLLEWGDKTQVEVDDDRRVWNRCRADLVEAINCLKSVKHSVVSMVDLYNTQRYFLNVRDNTLTDDDVEILIGFDS